MDKIIAETTVQPKKLIESGIIKYVYPIEEYEQASVDFMESQGHKIDRSFAMDLVWADDEFSDKYDFYMDFDRKLYIMEFEDNANK